MYLSRRIFDAAIQRKPDGSPGLIVDLSLQQLLNLRGIERFIDPKEIEKLLLSTNYMQTIDQNFQLLVNVIDLDISINHITIIENLESMENLRLLNLSNNRITKIENLEALRNLEVLDLSMNYIDKIQNLKNKELKTLILSGNNITQLENLYHLKKLQNLEIEKNLLEDINNLTIFGMRDLKKIVFAFNRIPIGYFEELLLILEAFKTLEEVNFVGNEVTLHKLYRAKILMFPNIQVLDKLALREPIKKHFESLRQDQEMKDLVKKTKGEYLERMAVESQLKLNALEMIEKQKKRVEEVFDAHQTVLQTDMQYFLDRAQEMKALKEQGLDQQVTQGMLDAWKEAIEKKEIERKEAVHIAAKKQQVIEKEYLENQMNSKKFTDKLYEISMKSPEVWKDIKLKEQEQNRNEDILINKARQLDPNDESEIQQYQHLANEIQINMIKDVAHAVIDYEAKELKEQREKAADVLKHALLKQMVNHYTAVRRRPGGQEEEYEEYEETETNTNVANPEKTEDQLRDMLHSRLYQDGQWKNVKKNNGPKDLSDRSLEQLLKINPAGKTVSQPSNSRKVIKKPMGNIREEHREGDESGNYRTRGGMPRKSQATDSLARDPFEGNGGTYYDEKHVVREGEDGEKIIMIPFEESGNMLDGLSEVKGMTGRGKSTQNLPQPQRQSTNVIIPQQVQPQEQESPTRPKKKKKKKDTLNNLLADLDQFDTNGNRIQPMDSPSKNQPYMNMDNGQKQSPKDPQMMRQPTIPGSQKQTPKESPQMLRKQPTIPGSQKQSPQSQGNQNPRVYPSPNNPNQQMMQPQQGQPMYNNASGPYGQQPPYGQQYPQNQMNNQPPPPQMKKSKTSMCNVF